MPADRGRRAALGRVGLALTAPCALAGCRCSREPEPAPPAVESARPGAPQREPIVRVRVRRVRTLDARVSIGSEGQWLRLHRDEAPASDAVVRAPVSVAVTARAWRIRDDQGHEPPVDGLETLAFSALDHRTALLPLDGTSYPGSLTFVARLDEDKGRKRASGYDVVNHVGLERYLPGVLAKELYTHWHPQTFAAQAIASRSYACTEHAYFLGRRHYDLTDTQSSQAYVGATGHELSRGAVAVTRGRILVYRGRLVSGYYSSCCGGLAASAVDAIGKNPINDTMPLRGRSGQDVCTDAPVYRWTRERAAVDVVARLRDYGKARDDATLKTLDGLTAVEVAETNAHGRPKVYRVRASGGAAAEIDASRLRRALDYARNGRKPPEKPLWSSFVRASVNERTVRIEGQGFGHGVGLCQYGAETLARSGTKARSILEWYYPGVEVVEGYSV